jgi:hypothetical protein
MEEAPTLKRAPRTDRTRGPRAASGNVFSASSFDHVDAVEIVAPDGYCAALLVGYANPVFCAGIVSGSSWVVRFEPPPRGRERVVEFLTVIEQWLEAAPLASAKVSFGGRSRLICASAGGSALRRTLRDGPGPGSAA